jgi:hypothetical protein
MTESSRCMAAKEILQAASVGGTATAVGVSAALAWQFAYLFLPRGLVFSSLVQPRVNYLSPYLQAMPGVSQLGWIQF